MPLIVPFEGTDYTFPDDITDDEIARFLTEATKPPPWSDVVGAVPGEAKRYAMSAMAGVQQAAGDLLDIQAWRDTAQGVKQELAAEREQEVPQNMTLLQEGVLSGGASALTMLPAMALTGPLAAAGGLARTIGPLTTLMGAQTGFSRYGDLRGAGFDPARSTVHAVFEGLVEKYTEYIPMKLFDVGGPLVRELIGYLTREGLGEQVATLLQDISAKLSDRPDMTLGDYFHDALVTAIATPVAGVVQGGFVAGAGALGQAVMPGEPPPTTPPPAASPGASVVPPTPVPPLPSPSAPTPTPQENVGAPAALPAPTTLPNEQLAAAAQGVAAAQTAQPQPQAAPEITAYLSDVGTLSETPLGPRSERLGRVRVVFPTNEQPLAMPRIFAMEPGAPHDIEDANEFFALSQQWVNRIGQSARAQWNEQIRTLQPVRPAGAQLNETPSELNARVDSEVIKAKEYVFPTAEAKALWDYGYALNRLQSGKPPMRAQLTALHQRAKELTGATSDFEVSDRALRYVSGTLLTQGAKTTEGTFNAPAIDVALELQQNHQAEIAGGLAFGIRPGQVAFAKSVSGEVTRPTPWMKTAQAYFQNWVKRFSPNMQIVIVEASGEAGARAWTFYNAGVNFVYIPKTPHGAAEKALALYVLAHEFGHMIINQHLHNPQNRDVYDALVEEYNKFMARTGNMSAMRYVREGRSPIDLISGDVMSTESAAQYLSRFSANYASFDEWLADQMVRYMHSKRELLQIEGERGFWEKLFSDLKVFFDRVVKSFVPSKVYADWVESLREQDSSLAQPGPSARVDYSRESQELEVRFKYTTRVLDDLPKKPSVKKVTIYGLLGRQDVREPERRLIGEVLKEFPGESVDRLLFGQAVVQRLYPLTLKDSQTFASYGTQRLVARAGATPGEPLTHLYESGAIRYTDRDFPSESNKLFAWARGFAAKARWWLTEIQSHYMQELASRREQQLAAQQGTRPEVREEDLRVTREEVEETTRDRDILTRILADYFVYLDTNQIPQILQKLEERWGRVDLPIESDYGAQTDITRAMMLLRAAQGQKAPGSLRPGVIRVGGSPRIWADQADALRTVRDSLRRALEEAQARVTEAQGRLQRLERTEDTTVTVEEKKFDDRWAEMIVRHEIVLAAMRGHTEFMMPTPDTVARMEGWGVGESLTRPGGVQWKAKSEVWRKPDGRLPEFELYTNRLKRRGSPTFERVQGREGQVYWNGQARRDDTGGLYLTVFYADTPDGPRTAMGEAPYDASNAEQTLPADILAWMRSLGDWSKATTSETFLRPYVLGHTRGIYDRYAELAKYVKKEFKAKLVVEDVADTGVQSTWYQVPLPAALADVPIKYFNLAAAVEETGNKIAARAGVPELPAAFQRFERFLLYNLQLNQVAKLLPNVVGLQQYRKAMRALHAFKARLFEGPNDRIKQWHALPWKVAKEVEEALQREFRQGEHWTELKQVEIDDNKGGKRMVWVHLPNPGFEKLMQGWGITPEGIDLFLGVKNDNLKVLQAMEEVVTKHLQAAFANNPLVLRNRLNSLTAEIKRLREIPFLPEMRFGRYTVAIRAGHEETVDGRVIRKNELVYWEKFETERARNKKFEELKREFRGTDHVISAGYDTEVTSHLRGLPRNVVQAVIEMLNSNEHTRLTEDQMNALAEVEFDQTAAGRFAKYLGTPAKHLAGSSKELRRSYAQYHWKIANAIAKLQYYRELTGALADVRRDIETIRRAGGVTDSYDKLLGFLQNNLKYVMEPQHEFEQLRMFASLWYLWGSAKTAVMNMTSVPILTFPYLWDRFGMLNAQGALLRAMKDVAQYWRDPSKLSLDKQHVLNQLKIDGSTDQSFASMLASVADGGVAFERMIPNFEFAGEATNVIRRTAWQITAMGMMPFRVVEQMNRQITGLAAYELMSQKIGKTLSSGDTTAYDFARDAIDYTQNEYGAWNRPQLLQGKKSLFLLFFSFVQNMSFLMFGGDKSWWKAMMVLAAMGGLQGLPGMDNIIDVMNWALRKLTGQFVDLRLEARETAKALGMNPDLVMHGVSHNWLGVGWSTSSSIGQGRIIPGTDAIFGIGKFEQRFVSAASEIGGPVGSMMVGWLQAMADDNPNAFSRWDRALPPVLRNAERAWEAYEKDVWANTRGKPLAEDPTALEIMGQALGFAPTRRAERQEELRAVHDVTEYYTQRRTNLLEMYFNAKRTRDPIILSEVRQRIQAFNSSVPSPKLKITGEDIGRSMRVRQRLEQESLEFQSPIRRYRELYRYIDGLY